MFGTAKLSLLSVGAVTVNLAVLAISAAAAPSPLCFSGLEVHSLVCDPIVGEARIDSLVRLALRRQVFDFQSGRGASTSIRPEQTASIENPFCIAWGDSAAPDSIYASIDIEQVTYGQVGDVKGAMVGLWVAGILGALAGAGDDFGSIVQLRVNVSSPRLQVPVTLVAVGGCFANPERLPRRAALELSAKRAVWNLVYHLAREMDSVLTLGLEKKRTYEPFDSYLARVDSSW